MSQKLGTHHPFLPFQGFATRGSYLARVAVDVGASRLQRSKQSILHAREYIKESSEKHEEGVVLILTPEPNRITLPPFSCK